MQYNCAISTIYTNMKEDSIKVITAAKHIKIISKLNNSVHEKTGNLLFFCLTEKQLARDSVTD